MFIYHLTYVQTIGGLAFYKCLDLESIIFGENLVTIDNMAFAEDNSLTGTLRIPNSVTTLGDTVFYHTDYSDIYIGSGIKELKQNCFFELKNLKDVYFSSDILSIGDGVFESCDKLTSLHSLKWEMLQRIGDRAFSGCINLTGDIYLNKDCIYNLENSFLNCPLKIRKK